MQYFQKPGIADAELARDVRTTIRRILYGASGVAAREGAPAQGVVPAGKGFLDIMPEPKTFPDWLTEADLESYVAEFARTGFTGGLNWYRTIDLSWELMAPWHGAVVMPPALYVAGDSDLVVHFPGMAEFIPISRPSCRT
jgi:hypothetical protein